MTEAIKPKSYKRYCPRQHDTWRDDIGRTDSNMCRQCQREKSHRSLRDRQVRAIPPAYLTNLKPYRKSRGFTVEAVAWEARMNVVLYRALEGCEAKATYAEAVRIYQALVVLSEREREQIEAQREREARVVRAGLL